MRLTSSGALAAVATISGVVFLFALAAESAPAASSLRTSARLLGPDLALAHTLLMSAAEPVASVLQQQGAGQDRTGTGASKCCQHGVVRTCARMQELCTCRCGSGCAEIKVPASCLLAGCPALPARQ
jgi:hypothetical protein